MLYKTTDARSLVWLRIVLRNFDDWRTSARLIKGLPLESAKFQHASDPSSFEALIAFELMARAACGHRRHGRFNSLQQHSGGEKEAGNYN